VSGPLWDGPLHDGGVLHAMARDADELGWMDVPPLPSSAPQQSLRSLLSVLQEEASLEGPPMYFRLDQIARVAGLRHRTPNRGSLSRRLQEMGFRVTRTHCDANALRTDAPWPAIVDAASAASAE
jgi:tRNA (guanine26-N2/guanine27-N2)-dimethyltransferase